MGMREKFEYIVTTASRNQFQFDEVFWVTQLEYNQERLTETLKFLDNLKKIQIDSGNAPRNHIRVGKTHIGLAPPYIDITDSSKEKVKLQRYARMCQLSDMADELDQDGIKLVSWGEQKFLQEKAV